MVVDVVGVAVVVVGGGGGGGVVVGGGGGGESGVVGAVIVGVPAESCSEVVELEPSITTSETLRKNLVIVVIYSAREFCHGIRLDQRTIWKI